MSTMTKHDPLRSYRDIARNARIAVLKMIYKAQSAHIGSNFSCIDILAVLFEKADLQKDTIIFSKGWVAASAYFFLAQKGVIPEGDLERYCMPGEAQYIGLLEPTVPGIRFAGGSMGYGLPAGVGFALSKKMKNESGSVYVLMSDGELAIGTTWESLLIARHHGLDNLVVIVDRNGLQAMGKTDDVLKAFIPVPSSVVDGHDFAALERSLDERPLTAPRVIDAVTVKGKGVSFMEHNNLYHYKAPDTKEYEAALAELTHA